MRNRMLRGILALGFSIAAFTQVKAQSPQEMIEPRGFSIGTNFGMTDMWGDVGTKSIVDHYNNDKYWKKPMFMGGLYVRYTIHPAVALRLGVNYGTLYATDEWNEHAANKASDPSKDDAAQRYIRNQDAKTNVWEGNLLVEINPFRFNVESGLAKKRFQPYLLAGVGGFHYRTFSSDIDRVTREAKWVDITDLHLEGQGWDFNGAPKQPSSWQLSVPLGVGVRWDIGNQLGLGIEYMWRMTFTDYLDGVSDRYIDPNMYAQHMPADKAALAADIADKSWVIVDPNYKHQPGELRGNKSNNDSYSTISITFFYKIKHRAMAWWH